MATVPARYPDCGDPVCHPTAGATVVGARKFLIAYNIKSHRDQERRWVEQAETAYARFVAGWNPRGPKQARTGAATEGRR